MANGRVITGFSKPYVALYSESGGTITYSGGMILARGVEVQIEPESAEDNNFYADNIVAETGAGVFTGGTVTLTVDGLKDAARKLILGLPTADSAGWTAYGSEMTIPFVGLGFIVRYQEDGVESYMPIILTKVAFTVPNLDANTQEEDIDWQTQELSATIFRADDANRNWKLEGTAVATEALAEAAIKTKLDIQ